MATTLALFATFASFLAASNSLAKPWIASSLSFIPFLTLTSLMSERACQVWGGLHTIAHLLSNPEHGPYLLQKQNPFFARLFYQSLF